MTADADIIAGLRAGDDATFRALVRAHHPSLVHVITTVVRSPSVAEETVQETWLAVIKGIKSFEGRSTIRTWIFGIALNLARKRVRKDGRIDLWESLSNPALEEFQILDDRFDHRGHWAKPPATWRIDPERQAEQKQLLDLVQRGIQTLPENQHMVILLRDVEGFSASEVCDILELSDSNQRVLLHRARTTVRHFVESALDSKGAER